MTPYQARSQLFDETLHCDLALPRQIQDRTRQTDAGAEMRLRAIALVEDGRIEDSEERQEKGAAFQRMEAKIDLLLALCSRLISNQEVGMETADIQLSARGLTVTFPEGTQPPETGSALAIHLQAAEWLPDPVTLPVTPIAQWQENDREVIALRFDGLSTGLQEALERHVFRLHRRNVAQQRQTR